MQNLKVLAITAGAAAVMFGALSLFDGEKPAPTTTRKEQQQVASSAPTADDEIQRQRMEKALEAIRAGEVDLEERPPLVIPTLDPAPPLQQLVMQADDSEESAVVKKEASSVRSDLKLQIDEAIYDCWSQPGKQAWAEFAVDVSVISGGLAASNARLIGIVKGDYLLSDKERECMESGLRNIGGVKASAETAKVLANHLPATERFLLQWPCSACTAGKPKPR